MRNYFNDDKKLNYWDIRKKKLTLRSPKTIYMNFDMYRDETIADDPVAIESKLAVFEAEISQMIKDKILNSSEIIITRSELEKLRIFLELLSFRSDLRMNQYKQKMFSVSTERLLSNFQPDGNYENLWKKELLYLADCRSYEQIKQHEKIDPIVKQEFLNLIEGYYMTIVDARGGEFILSDVFPTLEIYRVSPTINIHLHELYPISPTRMILLNHIIFGKNANTKDFEHMIRSSRIGGDLLKQPKPKYVLGRGYYKPEDTFTYHPVKIYEKDLIYINSLIMNEVRNGLMFRTPSKIISSVISFNNRDDIKQTHTEFERKLATIID